MELLDIEKFKTSVFLESDSNGRIINFYKLENVKTSDEIYYPNCIFISKEGIINPSSERVMSLLEHNFSNRIPENYTVESKHIIENPVFYFVYNTDNYYHFVYDSLPYLISYFELKKEVKNLKLLMNYPNYQRRKFYNFVTEFLEILDIPNEDLILIEENVLYSEVYFSDSYTHGINSNLPPRMEIYNFFESMIEKLPENGKEYPKKIYISRRTWQHGDLSNIGTNYTQKRKMLSEDKLVELLSNLGFCEVFTEKLSTLDKLLMFKNAEVVIGSIGGGLANVLFSNSDCKLITICSPTFFDVNNRFKYCFEKVNTYYYINTYHTEKQIWKKWMRVKTDCGKVGEIEEIFDEDLIIIHTDRILAGWNSEIFLNKYRVPKRNCVALDSGLNSEWDLEIRDFEFYIYKILN